MTKMTNAHETPGHLAPTPAAAHAFIARQLTGPVVMLNLLRFREAADYSATPELAPPTPISGAAAYRRYMRHAQPFLQQVGGDVLFLGQAGPFLIGPEHERWDLAMLVRYPTAQSFLSFTSNPGYLSGIGHRTAALKDSRLLPLVETPPPPATPES